MSSPLGAFNCTFSGLLPTTDRPQGLASTSRPPDPIGAVWGAPKRAEVDQLSIGPGFSAPHQPPHALFFFLHVLLASPHPSRACWVGDWFPIEQSLEGCHFDAKFKPCWGHPRFSAASLSLVVTRREVSGPPDDAWSCVRDSRGRDLGVGRSYVGQIHVGNRPGENGGGSWARRKLKNLCLDYRRFLNAWVTWSLSSWVHSIRHVAMITQHTS